MPILNTLAIVNRDRERQAYKLSKQAYKLNW